VDPLVSAPCRKTFQSQRPGSSKFKHIQICFVVLHVETYCTPVAFFLSVDSFLYSSFDCNCGARGDGTAKVYGGSWIRQTTRGVRQVVCNNQSGAVVIASRQVRANSIAPHSSSRTVTSETDSTPVVLSSLRHGEVWIAAGHHFGAAAREGLAVFLC
jgi:hypothetical protein